MRQKTRKEISSLVLDLITQSETNRGFADYNQLYEELRNKFELSEDDYSELIYNLEKNRKITREFGFNFDKLRVL